MKKKIINGLLFAVALVAATSSFVSCKDYEGDNYAELNEKYATLKDAYNKQVQAMQDYVLTSRYNSETGYSAEELRAKGTIKARLDDLEEYQTSLEEDSFPKYARLIHENNVAIATAQGIAEQAKGLAERDSAYLRSLLVGWDNGGTLGDMVAEAAGLLTALKRDTAKYNFAYDTLYAHYQQWNMAYDTLSTYYQQWNKAYKLANAAYDYIKDSKYQTIGEFEAAFDNAVANLQEQIDSLCDEMDAIKASLRQEVTGIEIQAAVNPIFGTFAYPVDVQSNILAAYYGTVTTQLVKFPTSDATLAQESSWVWKKSPITKDELEAVFSGPYFTAEKGDILMDEEEGNAGVLYLTVNPSNIDFTDNHNFSLRSSDNQLSKVKLSELKPCTEQLKWGYKRAIENSSNGFYSAQATIDKAQVKDVALTFKVSNLASTIEAMMNDWSKVRAADVAKLGYSILTGLQADAPRLGVQAQWKDEVTGWQNWVSKYDLAAVSVNPLGFDFLTKENNAGDVEYMDFSPAIVKLQSKIDAKIKAFDMELQQMIAIQLGLDTSELQNLDFKFDQVTNTINVVAKETKSGVWTAGEVIATVDMTDFLNSMKSNTDSAVDGLNKFVQSLDNIQGNIDSQLATIKTKIHNYLTRFMNGIDKVFNKAASFASHPNRFIQPALFATADGKDVFHISRTHIAPTQIKKGTKLMIFPTTLTGEVVAPAFKKYIAVVDAWKFDANYNPTEAVDNKFNTGAMNQVLDGNTYNIQKPFEYTVNAPAGTVLEIIYECLGYNGKVAGKKYYIEVYE
ncbi:MAG: hypothetical protein J6E43_05585 [Prevotella sp.]|nr:hypothetical protein [Prevotella sp.]